MPIWGALLGGLASGAVAAGGSALSASIQSGGSAEQAREQMAFQERMANSAYQRATTDMRAAGINPMVAYSQGGASAPPGAKGDVANPELGEGLSQGVTSGMALAALEKDLQQKDADIALAEAAKEAKIAETHLTENSAKTADLNNKKLAIELPAVKAGVPAKVKHGKINEKAAIYDAISGRVKDLLGIGASAAEIGNKISK